MNINVKFLCTYETFFSFSEKEIDFVQAEIKQCGIVLPAFQKIGGLLTAELTSNLDVIHSEVINVNKAIDQQVDGYTLSEISF